jgi:hypothetical protein
MDFRVWNVRKKGRSARDASYGSIEQKTFVKRRGI